MIRVNDQAMPWRPGMTMAQVMALLEDGGLYVVVRLNGRLISQPDFAATQVPDGAEIWPLPLIAGG